MTLALRTLILAPLLASCSAVEPGPTSSWEGYLARGQLLRAEESLAEGNRERARELASDALDQARRAAQLDVLARSQLLLGSIDSDPRRLEDALLAFSRLEDAEGRTRTYLALGAIHLEAGQPAFALVALLDAERTLIEAGLERTDAARLDARIQYRASLALTRQALAEEALARARRAALALTLLPETEERPMRRAVAQAIGDAFARLDDPQEAIRYHAEAAAMAQLLGDRAAELDAVEMLASDLEILERHGDAAGYAARAVELAVDLGQVDRARRLAIDGRLLLRRIGEPDDSPRWGWFEKVGL